MGKIKDSIIRGAFDIIADLPGLIFIILVIWFGYAMYEAWYAMDTWCEENAERCEEVKDAHPTIFGREPDTEEKEDKDTDKEREKSKQEKPIVIPYDSDRVTV